MILLFSTLLVLLLLGAPVYVALGVASAIYMLAYDIQPLIAIQQMFAGIDQFTLLAVPFFVLAGNLMNASEITNRIYGFARSVFGHLRGGLGHVNIFGSLIFAQMSGTAVADASGLGTIEIKAMRDEGFDTSFAVGLTAASATLGPIIPPSLALVVYGASANASVGQLFAAGIIPGLLMALAMHVLVYGFAVRRNYPRTRRVTASEFWSSFLGAVPALFAPIIILGGIMFGVFTPTEAAVVAAVYALMLDAAFYRNISWRELKRVLFQTFETTAVIMIMVSCSVVFGWILVRENAAHDFAQLVLSFASEPWQVMLALIVILLIAGCFMDTIAIILIATPLFLPVLQQFNIDVVQFGVVMVLSLMIGLITPPVGLLLFVLSRISGLSFSATTAACIPFMSPLGFVLILISAFPALTLTLPQLLFR